MRFLLAIIAFILAAAAILAGLAQRTVFAPATHVDASVSVTGSPRYLVIPGSVLNSHTGEQTITLGGASDPFLAYGRTSDVLAWIGTSQYASIGYDASTADLTSTLTRQTKTAPNTGPLATATPSASSTASSTPSSTSTATPSSTASAADTSSASDSTGGSANPNGSDLWLQQYRGSSARVTHMNLPSDVSVIIATNGSEPAPTSVAVRWPLSTATPWVGPLIFTGIGLAVVGLILYLVAIYKLRRSRGPRRGGGPKMPKLPRAPKYRPSPAIEQNPRGRRATRRALVAAPALLTALAVLSGCTAPNTTASASPASSSSSTASGASSQIAAAKSDGGPPPAVTVDQLKRIVSSIASVAATADASGNATELATRFEGPALQLRAAAYRIKAKKGDEAAPPTIPAGPEVLTLPQATTSWPRVVETVVEDKKNTKEAPIALVLVQHSPRENYMVDYAVSLEPDATVPDLAPATIGAPFVAPDTKLLALAPDDVAAAYGDILMKGEQSKFYNDFQADGDTLRTAVGVTYKANKKAQVPSTASLTFTNAVGSGSTIALATNSSGAIVTAQLDETETLKVVQAGAQVGAGASAAALSGVTQSGKGIASTYSYQLMFYIPPAGSKQKITLLGFAQGLVSASEVS